MVVSVLLGLLFLLRGKVLSVISYNYRYNAHLSFKDMGDMFLQDIHTAYVASGYDVFAPIFAVLPSATIFCDDFNSGYIKWILNRSSRKRYIRETMLCSSVGGSLAIFLPSLLSGLFYLINGKLNFYDDDLSSLFLGQTVYANFQYVWNGIAMFLFLLALSLLFGAFWSNVGLLVAILTTNKYLTLTMPFALYFIIHLVLYRTGGLLFSPMNILMPSASFIPFISFPVVYQGILLFLIILVCKRLFKEKLQNV